jgi:D-3-phosphoglycerate dehydrogenase
MPSIFILNYPLSIIHYLQENFMFKVLVSDALSPKGLEILKASDVIEVDVKTGLKHEALKEIIGNYDALVVRSASQVNADLLSAGKKLKVIGRAGIGVDNVDLDAATKYGIVVMNTPAGNATTTAEHTLAMMFAIARHIPQASASMKAGKWDKKKFEGRELVSKTLGLLGLGNIGRIVADRAIGLKMRVVVYDPFLPEERIRALGAEPVTLYDLLKQSDFLSVHTPLSNATRGLIGDEAFDKMKPGVFIINCARGGIVDEASLLRALENGKVAGAALDVFVQEPVAPNDPLVMHPKVICTPHLGASTEEAQEKVAIDIAYQVIAFLRKGELTNTVNVPPLSAEALAQLMPFLLLSERLGSLLSQLVGDDSIKDVEVELAGKMTELPQKPPVTAVVVGLLQSQIGSTLNFVNAQSFAQERNIIVKTSLRAQSDFLSEVAVLVRTKSGVEHKVAGTVFAEGGPRIVKIDQFQIEAIPEGRLLIVRNEDKPGVIGRIGTYLGEKSINVSRLQMCPDPNREEALSLWSIARDVTQSELDEIRKLSNILFVTQAKFS